MSDKADEGAIRRVRHKVLERIALDSTPLHLTVRSGADGWQPFLQGISCKVLSEHEGALTYLLRLQPGAVLPGHRHAQDEECLVLEGEIRIGDALVVRQGDYHLGRAGVLHASMTSDNGALLFLRGAAPDPAHFL